MKVTWSCSPVVGLKYQLSIIRMRVLGTCTQCRCQKNGHSVFPQDGVGDFKDVEWTNASTPMNFHFYQMGSEMLVVVMKKMGEEGGIGGDLGVGDRK